MTTGGWTILLDPFVCLIHNVLFTYNLLINLLA